MGLETGSGLGFGYGLDHTNKDKSFFTFGLRPIKPMAFLFYRKRIYDFAIGFLKKSPNNMKKCYM